MNNKIVLNIAIDKSELEKAVLEKLDVVRIIIDMKQIIKALLDANELDIVEGQNGNSNLETP
ncbi:MAG: hypothetical protein H8D45_20850 [Bacteroidetes bacterium]|nr:hypothetical protein [Bacteroidota bacterium]